QVQMRADTRLRRDGPNQVVAGLGRFETAQPDAEVARQFAQRLQQMPQACPLRTRSTVAEIDAVVAQVDAGQHNFLMARCDQTRYFLDDLADGTTANDGTNLRDDAEAAMEQAAVLH